MKDKTVILFIRIVCKNVESIQDAKEKINQALDSANVSIPLEWEYIIEEELLGMINLSEG